MKQGNGRPDVFFKEPSDKGDYVSLDATKDFACCDDARFDIYVRLGCVAHDTTAPDVTNNTELRASASSRGDRLNSNG